MTKPLVLIILDGWGIAAPWGGNAIALAKTPHMNQYAKQPSFTVISASGEAVGLPAEEPGNSEVGHLTIGAGRIIKQDLPLINKSIADGTFFTNPQLLQAIDWVKKKKSTLHLLGLISTGGVHSHSDHLYALMTLAKKQGLSNVAIHMITDGRDTSPYAAIIFLNRLEQKIHEIGIGTIVSVCGRYYAMDRDRRWQRTQAAYEAYTLGKGRRAVTAQIAIAGAYQESFTDEFIPPTNITADGTTPTLVNDGDAVIFYNFRPDRARQLSKAFVDPEFRGFSRPQKDIHFVTMTEYEHGLPASVAFAPEHVQEPLAKVISDAGLTQLHVSETEKYAHVTYFLNGLEETPFPGEARQLVQSPKVATYDLAPAMAAKEIGDVVVKNLSKGQYDVVFINFANADMVGHTGNLKATIQACEVVDTTIGTVVEAVMRLQGSVIITADHGNAEQKLNPKTGDIDTAHTANPVPFAVVSADPVFQQPLRTGGGLADVAPTLLTILGLPIPASMTGSSLLATKPAGAVV